MLAYINFLSTGVPIGKAIEGRGVPQLPPMDRAADPARGAVVYQQACASCHGADGSGKRRAAAPGYEFPPLWGPGSFNDGAGMHRLIASASFIHANMPFGASYADPILSAEDSWDAAAYVNSQPRPRKSGLDRDYPNRARKPPTRPSRPSPIAFRLSSIGWARFNRSSIGRRRIPRNSSLTREVGEIDAVTRGVAFHSGLTRLGRFAAHRRA